MIKKYRKTFTPEAAQFTTCCEIEMLEWARKQESIITGLKVDPHYRATGEVYMTIHYDDDTVYYVQDGDWLVKAKDGHIYPVPDEEFRATYEEVVPKVECPACGSLNNYRFRLIPMEIRTKSGNIASYNEDCYKCLACGIEGDFYLVNADRYRKAYYEE
jgi:hypothetical protein